MTTTDIEETIGEIAAKDIRKAALFQSLGIDFCCGGKRTVKEACQEAGVTEAQLDTALKQAVAGPAGGADQPAGGADHDFNRWEPDFLADYIVNVHHRYVRDNAPVIEGLAVKVAGHHKDNHPELIPLVSGIRTFLQELQLHMGKEETILFPLIKQLVAAKRKGEVYTEHPLPAPIRMMIMEHAVSGEELRVFRKLTQDYTLPSDACNSYTYLFEKMKAFENDLFRHIHLENNILFPKALELEKERL